MRKLRTRLAVALLGGCTPFLLGTGSAPAQGLLDANCGPSTHVTGVPSGNWRIGQNFPAQRTGGLVRGEIEINKSGSPGGNWVMQILATDDSLLPVNTVLASTTPIPDSTVPAGDSRLAGVFASPARVEAGEWYTLIVTRPGAAQFGIRYQSGNPCPGEQLHSDSQGGSFLGTIPGVDTTFAVFVKPSNAFTLGRLQRNKRRGTATLTVNVPYPGELALSGNGVKTAGATRAVAVSTPGNVELLIRAKGKKRRKLNETGKVKVRPKVTYTPTGGDPATQSQKLTLEKRL
jgi:hypothetical protein